MALSGFSDRQQDNMGVSPSGKASASKPDKSAFDSYNPRLSSKAVGWVPVKRNVDTRSRRG